MSHVQRQRKARNPPLGIDKETIKVVLIELTTAGGPVSAGVLSDRTLLSKDAVRAALTHLTESGICTAYAGNDRRPPRFSVEA